MRTPALLALMTTLTLAACGGGAGGGSTLPAPSSTATPNAQANAETAIDSANSVGDPVKSFNDYNESVSGSSLATRSGSVGIDIATNTCVPLTGGGSVELFVPDKNNDANSTEEQYFYDNACANLARDIVRVYTINGTSETVTRTENQYASGNSATPEATRTSTVSFINGTYGANGYPVVADGFGRSAVSQLDLGSNKTLLNDDELVVSPSSSGTSAFCGDAAGFNWTGIAALNETFGWESVTNGGTRTVNGDGSITWSSTHTGNAVKGAIGALSIASGTANAACPISTPEFTLAGGSAQGTYTIPVTAQYLHGQLIDLTISGATLPNGNTLDVTTNTSVSPTSSTFITGVVSNGGTTVATFAVDTFGDGTLTVTSSGTTYTMTDWHVAK